MSTERRPVVLPPGGGRRHDVPGIRATFEADGAETGDAHSISTWRLDPHTTGPGPHSRAEDGPGRDHRLRSSGAAHDTSTPQPLITTPGGADDFPRPPRLAPAPPGVRSRGARSAADGARAVPSRRGAGPGLPQRVPVGRPR